MTFSELFARHGYSRMCDICAVVTHPNGKTLSKAHLAMVWYGHNRLGANLAKLIAQQTGVPLADLLFATPEVPPGRTGRPRRTPHAPNR
jgi:hypothetical protein